MVQLRFKKKHRKKLNLNKTSLKSGNIGSFSIKALQPGELTSKHKDLIKKIVSSNTQKRGKVKLQLHFTKVITSKPLKSRMGKGKGAIDSYRSHINLGDLFIELHNISVLQSKAIFTELAYKLPLRIKLVCNY